MAVRRRPDTSALFTSAGIQKEVPPVETAPASEVQLVVPASEAKPSSDPAPKADKPAAAKKPAKTGGKEKKAAKTNGPRKSRKDLPEDPRDRQSVKLGFYLTPRIYEAIQLHKAVNFIGAHNDSQIVNKALAMYLASELDALKACESEGDIEKTEERLEKARKKILVG